MNTSYHLTQDSLAQGLKNARRQANKTQSDISEIAHVTVPTISAIENGNGDPKVSTLLSFINELEVSPNDLFDYSEDMTLADIVKALLVLYFYEGVDIQGISTTDAHTGQEKQMIQITITQGDIRRILADFLHFRRDRKTPSEILKYMTQKMDKLKSIKAWTEKDIPRWRHTVKRMSGWGKVASVSELALKRFFFGGKLWTENPDPDKFITQNADIDCYRRYMYEESWNKSPCSQAFEMEMRRIYVLDQIRLFLDKKDAIPPYKEALNSFLETSQISESDLKEYFSEIGFSKEEIDKILEGDVLDGKSQITNKQEGGEIL